MIYQAAHLGQVKELPIEQVSYFISRGMFKQRVQFGSDSLPSITVD